MHRRSLSRLLAAVLLLSSTASLASLAGCAGESGPEAAPGSAREALLAFNEALKNQDKEGARRWVPPSQVHQDFFEMIYKISEVQQKFIAKVGERWGPDAIETFEQPPGTQLHELMPYQTQEVLDRVVITEVGEIAMVRFEDGGMQRLLRTEGRWLVDTVGSERPEDINIIFGTLQEPLVVARALHDSMAEIDQPDVDLETFDLMLGRRIEERLNDYREQLMKAYEEAQKQAEQEAKDTVGPSPPGSTPPVEDTGHGDHDGHDH